MKQEKVEQRLHIPNTLIDSNSVSSKQVPVHSLPVQINKHRILCVDDEIPGTRMRGEILRERGYSVVLYQGCSPSFTPRSCPSPSGEPHQLVKNELRTGYDQMIGVVLGVHQVMHRQPLIQSDRN